MANQLQNMDEAQIAERICEILKQNGFNAVHQEWIDVDDEVEDGLKSGRIELLFDFPATSTESEGEAASPPNIREIEKIREKYNRVWYSEPYDANEYLSWVGTLLGISGSLRAENERLRSVSKDHERHKKTMLAENERLRTALDLIRRDELMTKFKKTIVYQIADEALSTSSDTACVDCEDGIVTAKDDGGPYCDSCGRRAPLTSETGRNDPRYSIFKVNGDYIVAETQEQAVAHHLKAVGTEWYAEGEEPEVEMIPHDRLGRFETESGWDEKTFGEWLADFEYTGPTIICWNE